MTVRRAKWIGTALQIAGCIMLALNLSWSGYAFLPMLAGSLLWLATSTYIGDGALAVQNLAFVGINIVGVMRWI